MTTIDAEFKNQMLRAMKDREFGEVIKLNREHPNYAKSVAAGKIIIDWEQDLDNGFVLTFNDDFTAIRKQKRPW